MITKVSSLFYLRKEEQEHSKNLQKQICQWFESNRGQMSLTVQNVSFDIFRKVRKLCDTKYFYLIGISRRKGQQ